MRRFVGLVLLLATLAMASPALAQPSAFTILGPGGTLLYSNASVTAANSAGAVSLFQYIVPAAYVATQSTVGAVVQPVSVNVAEPPFGSVGIAAGAALTSIHASPSFGMHGTMPACAATFDQIRCTANVPTCS